MHPRTAALALFLFAAAPAVAADWPPFQVSATLPQVRPVMIADGEGGAFLAWTTGNFFTDVRLAHFTRTGTLANGWPAGGVAAGWTDSQGISLLSDGRSGVIIGWEVSYYPPYFSIYRLQRRLGNGKPAPGWTEEGVATFGPSITLLGQIAIVPDSRGGAILFAPSVANPFFIYPPPILAMHIDDRGRLAWDDWRAVSTGPDFPLLARAASDGRGGAFVAWAVGTNADARLALQHVTDVGSTAAGWPAQGLALGGADLTHISPEVLSDGSGGAIVIWATTGDVRALRVLANGTFAPGWSAAGNVVFQTAGRSLQVCEDGAGGFIAAWEDMRPGSRGSHVRAQRVGADGTVRWLADGVPVCTARGSQFQIALAPDHAGGVWLSWSDGRVGGFQFALFASHVLASGEIAEGIPEQGLQVFSDYQGTHSAIVFDPGGPPLVAWEDRSDVAADPRVLLAPVSAPRATADAATLAADSARPSELPRLRVASASGARLEFRNETPGETRLEILDLAGRRIAARELGWIAAGPQSVTLPALGGLRSGIYFVRITRADRVSVARLVVLE